MISCDFAPNERWDDAWISFKLLFQPWRWKRGKESKEVKKQILANFQFPTTNFQIFLFLTGRSALYYLLKSLNLKPGTEILVQALTCEAVVLPIIALKLKPVFVDIEERTFSMNPIDLEKKLTKQAKVAILQHTFGATPIHRPKMVSIIKRHNLMLIEDIAHGAQFPISNFQFPNSCFLMSFGRSKALSSVFGGAIVTNNQKIAKKLSEMNLDYPSYSFIFKCLLYKPIVMLIRSTYNIFMGKLIHKIAGKLGLIIPEITTEEKKGQYNLLFNKAYPNALAVLLLHQLGKFGEMQKNRVRAGAIYRKITNYQLPITNFPLLRFPLLVNNRNAIIKQAAKRNIFLGKWYDQVVAPEDFDLKQVGYRPGSCPTAEKACKKIINLPTNISITDAKKIVKTLNDVLHS